MKSFKHVSYILAVFFLSNQVIGQDKINELGLRYNFDQIELIYKRAYKTPNTFMRYRLSNLNGGLSSQTKSFGLGGGVGMEWRYKLNNKFNLQYGFEIGGLYSFFDIEESFDYKGWAVYATPVIGVQYKITKNFGITLDYLPSLILANASSSNYTNYKNHLFMSPERGFGITTSILFGKSKEEK